MPQFVTRKTVREMALESKKATEEAMKNLVIPKKIEESFADSDDDIRDSTLENRIHYLKLELNNKQVDLCNRNTELEELKKVFEYFMKVDIELAQLDKLDFFLKDIDTMSSTQIQKVLQRFKDEENEHMQLCMNAIMKIDLSFIKESMIHNLKLKKNKNRTIENKLRFVIKKKIIIHELQIAFMICSIVFMIGVCLFYYLG